MPTSMTSAPRRAARSRLENFSSATPILAPAPYASGYRQWILYSTGSTTRYFAIRAMDNAGWWSSGIATVTAAGITDLQAPGSSTLAVTRLAGEGPGGKARIRWTSAGDDGSSGVPASYDLRVSEVPISGPNFDGATPVEGTPSPVDPGTLLTVYYEMDECTQYFFALRTIDEQGNCSGVSNSPSATGYCQSGMVSGDDGTAPAGGRRADLGNYCGILRKGSSSG